MNNYYEKSWELYKAQTEDFVGDFDYYLNFCKKYKTLDIFAGYGRLTNYLYKNNIDVEAVELEPNFAKYINLPLNKKHICDFLTFSSPFLFERIVAGFNSFCLLRETEEIKIFFKKISSLLTSDGKASLSYYHHDFWEQDSAYSFYCNGEKIYYEPDSDLSGLDNGIGIWIDRYKKDNMNLEFRYPTKIYDGLEQLESYIQESGLFIDSIIKNYGASEPNGWIEFVLGKINDDLI